MRMDFFLKKNNAATRDAEASHLFLRKKARCPRDRAGWPFLISKRAYFYAEARRPVFIEMPAEDREEGDENMIGQLQLSLYGTRDAAPNWAAEYTSHLVHLGFKVGRASPCNLVHDQRGLALTVHGDDFVLIGDETPLQWLGDKMKDKYELKMDVLGPDTHEEKDHSVHHAWSRV